MQGLVRACCRVIGTGIAVLLFAGSVYAAEISKDSFGYYREARQGRVALGGSIGFTLDPDTFLLAPTLDYFFTQSFSLGPLLQLGVTDHRVLFAPTANFKYTFDIRHHSAVRRLTPFVQAGVGLVVYHDNRIAGDATDVGFLGNLGFGFDYYLNNRLSLGNNMLFNISSPVLGSHFFFSWQFVTVRYLF